jgi:hypothetical protein
LIFILCYINVYCGANRSFPSASAIATTASAATTAGRRSVLRQEVPLPCAAGADPPQHHGRQAEPSHCCVGRGIRVHWATTQPTPYNNACHPTATATRAHVTSTPPPPLPTNRLW